MLLTYVEHWGKKALYFIKYFTRDHWVCQYLWKEPTAQVSTQTTTSLPEEFPTSIKVCPYRVSINSHTPSSWLTQLDFLWVAICLLTYNVTGLWVGIWSSFGRWKQVKVWRGLLEKNVFPDQKAVTPFLVPASLLTAHHCCLRTWSLKLQQ